MIKGCVADIKCRVTDFVEKHDTSIPDAVHVWIDPGRKGRRTIHAKGDVITIVDGLTIPVKKEIKCKQPKMPDKGTFSDSNCL